MTRNLNVVLQNHDGRNYRNVELTCNVLGVILGIDGHPLLNLVLKLFLNVFERGLDDLTGITRGRPEVKNNNTTHSIFSTVT